MKITKEENRPSAFYIEIGARQIAEKIVADIEKAQGGKNDAK